MPNLELIVTGAPRSGLGYTAQMLTRLGIRCGHELFGNLRTCSHLPLKGDVDWRHKFAGDASWWIAPYIGRFTGHILHITRHPRRACNSMIQSNMMTPEVKRYMKAWVPERWLNDELGRAKWVWFFWARWNNMIRELANSRGLDRYVHLRAEDATDEELRKILLKWGYADINRSEVWVDTKYNTSGKEHKNILPLESAHGSGVFTTSREFGYNTKVVGRGKLDDEIEDRHTA